MHNLDAVERRSDARRLSVPVLLALLLPAAAATMVVSTAFGAEPLPLTVVVDALDRKSVV